MKSTKSSKKLKLAPVTLRRLTVQLANVKGGEAIIPSLDTCQSLDGGCSGNPLVC